MGLSWVVHWTSGIFIWMVLVDILLWVQGGGFGKGGRTKNFCGIFLFWNLNLLIVRKRRGKLGGLISAFKNSRT